jgi:hypothetical protein
MNINFTKEQYETLLKMVQLGFWVTSSNEDTSDQSAFSEMEQYLMSFAKEFDCEGIEYDDEYRMYDVTVEREQEIHQVINKYEDMVFWDKLAYYLAKRDFKAEMTRQPLEEDAAFQRLLELEEEYHQYFEKHGLEQVIIDKKSR